MRYWLALTLLLAGPASAAAEPPSWLDRDRLESQMRQAETMIRQGVDKMLGSLDEALRAIPQYEMPKLDGNGDIIMRRKRSGQPPGQPDGEFGPRSPDPSGRAI